MCDQKQKIYLKAIKWRTTWQDEADTNRSWKLDVYCILTSRHLK